MKMSEAGVLPEVLPEDSTKEKPYLPMPAGLDKLIRIGRKFIQCVRIALNIWGITDRNNPPGPVYASLGIADPCNHKCAMCGDHPPEERISPTTEAAFFNKPGIMSLENFKKVVDDLRKMGTYDIELVGQGEPTLHHDIVEMVEYARRKGMGVRMVSNGSRLFKKEAEAMVDLGLDRLQISTNAGNPETYPAIHVTETPEDFLKVKANLKYLNDYKASTGKKAPHIRMSFVISSPNCLELDKMVQVVHDVGSEEALFNHVAVHEGTQDLMISEEDYKKMHEIIPIAKKLAAKLGVQTNLDAFAATAPSYMQEKIVGDPVVPCYVGSYFTRILGNGDIIPCCQCTQPLAAIGDSSRLKESWSSPKYGEFRVAAENLPEQNELLNGCECDKCVFRPSNITLHNLLFPFKKVQGRGSNWRYHLGNLFKAGKGNSN